MNIGHFYYINDQYYIDFPDPYLMKNKEVTDGVEHDRPCFYTFAENSDVYWVIPFSSRVEKFQRVYDGKIAKRGVCDTIVFGEVLGHRKAFLIQNMCPITRNYIKNEYLDNHTGLPVEVDARLRSVLLEKAKKVLALQRRGIKVIFPDVLSIEKQLLVQLMGK